MTQEEHSNIEQRIIEVLKTVYDPDIRIITLTITEGGYNISRQTLR